MENIVKHGVLPVPVVNTREHEFSESAPLCSLCAVDAAVSVEKNQESLDITCHE